VTAQVVAGGRGGWWRQGRVSLTIIVVGLIVTAVISWTAWRIDRNSEHRLLVVQTRQAANVVSSAILAIEGPLQNGLDVAAATNGDGQQFSRYMATYVAAGGMFTAASLWRTGNPTPIATAGGAASLAPASAAAQAFVARAAQRVSFVVTSV
jgi:hypothetical protein